MGTKSKRRSRASVRTERPDGHVGAGSETHPGMRWITGGTFLMGSDVHYPEEAPAHRVAVGGFWMDTRAVTNKEFGRFVGATGYVTVAERSPDPADYPDADPTLLNPSSSVFVKPAQRVSLDNPYNWWTYVEGAQWRHPQGPNSSVHRLPDHPVVHVAWADVEAYAQWVGKELPTEAEWEFAARGGLDGATYAWGDELVPGGRNMANTWQGEFPWYNRVDDGYEGTSPVDAFPVNGYGLHDMIGNVWEWTTDWYSPVHQGDSARPCCGLPHNPLGCAESESYDPAQPAIRIPRKVLKG